MSPHTPTRTHDATPVAQTLTITVTLTLTRTLTLTLKKNLTGCVVQAREEHDGGITGRSEVDKIRVPMGALPVPLVEALRCYRASMAACDSVFKSWLVFKKWLMNVSDSARAHKPIE